MTSPPAEGADGPYFTVEGGIKLELVLEATIEAFLLSKQLYLIDSEVMLVYAGLSAKKNNFYPREVFMNISLYPQQRRNS